MILWRLGFYETENGESSFFSFGCSEAHPIFFFNKKITSMTTFYFLQIMMFVHQLLNNIMNTTVYPWIINVVQNRNCRKLEISIPRALLYVNMFDLYSEIDLVLILIGFNSQISFIITICFANFISTTIINGRYLQDKKNYLLSDEEMI